MTTVRRAYGPLLTTGVALATAGVVVANPVISPRGDIEIPAVQLSAGSNDASSMLDDSFLDAIAPAPAESTNPLTVLKNLFSSLAADATHIGKNAIVSAFIAGMSVVSDPELTASTTTVADPSEIAAILPPVGLPELTGILAMPEFDLGAVFPDYIEDSPVFTALAALPDTTPMIAAVSVPEVKSFVTNLASDAGYVGNQVLRAAFAAGALVVAEPLMIVDTLRALIAGDFHGALEKAVTAVVAPLGPPKIVLEAVTNVVGKYLPEWEFNTRNTRTPGSVPDGEPAVTDPSDGTDSTSADDGPRSAVLPSAAVRVALSPRAARSLAAESEQTPTDTSTAEAGDEDQGSAAGTQAEAPADAAADGPADTPSGAHEATRPGQRVVTAARVAAGDRSDGVRADARQRSKAASAAE